jgi:hypothetical protein
MKPGSTSVKISSERIRGPRHACAFFDGLEEEYRVLLPFASACAKCGERCLQFLDGEHKSERLRRLTAGGADLPSVPGATELRTWPETYLRDGRFVMSEMLELAREILKGDPGAPRVRLWANMEWAVSNVAAKDELLGYESRLNPLIDDSDAIVVCAYQVGRHSPEVALGVLKAHPWILVGDSLEANPCYSPGAEGAGTGRGPA